MTTTPMTETASYTDLLAQIYPTVATVDWVTEAGLRLRTFTELEWLIAGELPARAYTVCLGSPKVGKTANSFPMAKDLAKAGHRVMYLAMDDNDRRMQNRSFKIDPEPHPAHEQLLFQFGWRPTSVGAAILELAKWLTMAREEGNPFSLVVIDTYGQFVGPKKNSTDVFGADNAIGTALKNLSETTGCAIFVNHHTRKARAGDEGGDWTELVSGTNGITAAADAIWYISRTRGSREGVLRITGNDIPEEIERPMTLGDDLVWRESMVTTPAQAAHTGAPRTILEMLGTVSEATIAEIKDETGLEMFNVKKSLTRLADEGLVANAHGSWSLTMDKRNTLPGRQTPVQFATPAAGPVEYTRVEPSQSSADLHQAVPDMPMTVPLQRQRPATAAGLDLDMSGMDPDNPKTGAIKASMALMTDSVRRESTRYHPSLFAAQPQAVDGVWEGRNKWEFEGDIPFGTEIVRFDKCAAYLSAANTKLPVGPLTRDDTPVGAEDKKLVGYHKVAIPVDCEYDCGGPFYTRTDRVGNVWITTPTLKQLNAYHDFKGMERLRVLDSWTAPGTEVLLRPWIDVLKTKRAEAIAAGDDAVYAFVKHCYSLAISTMGESKSNYEIRRPDWRHIIQAQAYANLWRKAWQAQADGATIMKVGNTDEIWAVDDRFARDCFPQGRDLGQWSVKGRIVVGETAGESQ